MGDIHSPADWPEDDDFDWVRLYALRPNLWYSLLKDLGQRPEPAALARFVERCVTSLRCLTDVHERLPDVGLTLGQFTDLYEVAWAAQLRAVEREDRPVDDQEEIAGYGVESGLKGGRLEPHRENWRPDLAEALAPELRDLVINLHLRGLDDQRLACALGVPPEWPGKIVAAARLNPKARSVVRAHLEGKSLGQIRKATGVSETTSLRLIRRIGERPHGAQPRVDARDRARTIVKLRDKGMSYKDIARRLDCSIDDVKNALRRDRRHRYGGKGPAA